MRYMILIITISIGLMGCPEPPATPFNTTGEDTGTWWGKTEDQTQEIVACPLTITLKQDLSKPYPGNRGVEGTVIVDYSCLELPEWVDEIPPSEVSVGGVLADDATLSIASGGCGPGVCVVLVLSGQGLDSTGDGFMDTYTGDWSYIILLAGIHPFGITGGFAVTSLE